MRTDFEGLWLELRDALKTSGDLPLRADVLTPAEIAEYVRKTSGDGRPNEFVWDYYYPRFYGDEEGAMSDEDAADLVRSLRKRSPTDVAIRNAHASRSATDQPSCGVCRRRDAEGVEPGARS
jgi:hypothetical protein